MADETPDVTLTEAEREALDYLATADCRKSMPTKGTMQEGLRLALAALDSVAAAVAAEREARETAEGDSPSGFWSQREWEDWSNDLATLIPDDRMYGNPEGAQESIIEDTLRGVLAELEAAERKVAAVRALLPNEALDDRSHADLWRLVADLWAVLDSDAPETEGGDPR